MGRDMWKLKKYILTTFIIANLIYPNYIYIEVIWIKFSRNTYKKVLKKL